MKSTNINLRITQELKEQFYQECEKNIQTPSVVLRELLKLYIEKGIDTFDEVH